MHLFEHCKNKMDRKLVITRIFFNRESHGNGSRSDTRFWREMVSLILSLRISCNVKSQDIGHRRVWSLWKKLIANCDVSGGRSWRTDLEHARRCCLIPRSSGWIFWDSEEWSVQHDVKLWTKSVDIDKKSDKKCELMLMRRATACFISYAGCLGRSRSSMLVSPESSSAVPVMIRSKSVSIYNRSVARLADTFDSSIIRVFWRGTQIWCTHTEDSLNQGVEVKISYTGCLSTRFYPIL